jgi:hypothetical protein
MFSLPPSHADEITKGGGVLLSMERSTALVRAPLTSVFAYLTEFDARSRWSELDIERRYLEKRSDHHSIFYMAARDGPNGFKKLPCRDFVSSHVWKRLGEDEALLVCVPTEHRLRPAQAMGGAELSDGGSAEDDNGDAAPGAPAPRTRCKAFVTMLVTELSPDVCRIVVTSKMEIPMLTPMAFQKYINKTTLRFLTASQALFLQQRALDVYDADDGVSLGSVMMTKSKGEGKLIREKMTKWAQVRMREVFEKHKGLSELGNKYEWFEGMLVEVLKCNLDEPKDVRKKKLTGLTLVEGRMIGKGLAVSLSTSPTPSNAVEDWTLTYVRAKRVRKRCSSAAEAGCVARGVSEASASKECPSAAAEAGRTSGCQGETPRTPPAVRRGCTLSTCNLDCTRARLHTGAPN